MKQLKTSLIFFLAICLNLAAGAGDIYVSQTALGLGDGSSAANAQSVSWLNNSGNWGAGTGQIKAGDTVHLVGTITSQIGINGDGTAGNVITIYWENGAKLSQPAGSLVSCQNRHYILFDGGVNGIIENTDNGIGLGHQTAVSGIYASGTGNLEVRNLTFRNFFIHPSQPNSSTVGFIDFTSSGALYMNGYGSNISVHNNSFSNICWILYFGSGSGNGINIYSNNFANYDHAIASLGDHSSNVNIFNNHFGSTANWDTGTKNYYHHDGIHIFYGGGSTLSGVQIYNNLFDGDWGSNNTAHIFAEGDFTHANQNSISNVKLYNNVFIQWPGDVLNNGFVNGGGPDWAFYNNTFVGAAVYNANAISIGGSNLVFINNLVSGVNTFVSIGQTNQTTFSCNLYANPGPGGNSPWYNGPAGGAINVLSLWQNSIGGDNGSTYIPAAVIKADGTLISGSLAIGMGTNLSSIFTTDIMGNPRPVSGAWTVGAYQSLTSLTKTNSTGFGPAAPQNLFILSAFNSR